MFPTNPPRPGSPPQPNPLAVLTPEAEDALALEIAQRMFAEEQCLGGSPTRDSLLSRHYRMKPATPEEFLLRDEYAGRYGKGLYPKWLDELKIVLEPANGITEWIISGAIGTGKSTISALALAYKLHCLGCLWSPSDYYNLMKDSPTIVGVYSLFKYKSQEDNYQLLKTMVDGIPFFKECFPRPKHYKPTAADDLDFPNRVSVIAGSNELHAIGLNLLFLLMDEVNFMKQAVQTGRTPSSATTTMKKIGQAQSLYLASKRRLESRFQFRGAIPGLMILLSSRNVETSFLETRIREAIDQPNVHISDYPLWEVKPKENYCGKKFFIEVGDLFYGSRKIEVPTDAREDARVLAVPIEHEVAFTEDIEAALRDIAGVASAAVGLFIRDREAIRACIDPKLFHPFKRSEFSITHLDEVPISEYFDIEKIIKIVRSFCRPRLNAAATRYVHIDLAESSDAAGFAMGHVSSLAGTAPRITIDMKCRILAPNEGEIDFSKICDFILYLRDVCGYPIKRASFDRFQSTHARQILTRLGFEAPLFSVDKTDEAYIVLRSTMYEGRLSVYDYPIFFTELTKLLHDRVKRKVDHPEGGSKDVADAVCGVVAQLTEALAKDPSIYSTENSNQLLPPQGRSLQERLEEQGILAATLATR